jgi:multiple sugar transport system ATP-binding protein
MSGGQRQRVAIGRAIVRDPKVFLFDEPLSNLDAKLRVQMRVELQKLHQKLQATMVYVTHDQTEAMTLGDRIVVLKDGDIMQIGKPMELYNDPQNKFVAGFIGSPPINLLEGMIKRDDTLKFIHEESGAIINLSEQKHPFLQVHIDKKLFLGIRPEDIHSRPQNSPQQYSKLTLPVNALEQMGNENLVYSQLGTSQVIARFKPDARVEVNSDTDFYLDQNKMHFFDPDSEGVIK